MRNYYEKGQAWHQKQPDGFCKISKPICEQCNIQEHTGQESEFQMLLKKKNKLIHFCFKES